jgi:FkbM family methyltransferase
MRKLIKFLLHILPFKKHIFTLIKKVFHPSEKTYRHLYFTGEITIPVSKTSSFKMIHYGYQLENELFWSGLTNGWEKESIHIWKKLCVKSSVILDIGANTGVYALLSQSLNSSAAIYSFEPVERVYQKLVKNVQLNQYPIKSFEVALSNNTGEAIIYDQPTEHVYSVAVNVDISNTGLETIPTKIKTLRLDDFIRNEALDKIDLIKLDVETHEAEVIEGMGEFAAKFKPDFLIELLNDEVAGNVENLLKGIEYDFYNIDEKNGLTKCNQLTKSNSYNFLICKKETSHYLGLNG